MHAGNVFGRTHHLAYDHDTRLKAFPPQAHRFKSEQAQNIGDDY